MNDPDALNALTEATDAITTRLDALREEIEISGQTLAVALQQIDRLEEMLDWMNRLMAKVDV